MRKNLKNKEIIEAIDKIISKRDSKTRKPQNKNAVILLTGGVDSSILADMYLSWSKSGKIYPIYIKRGAKAEKFELLSAKKVVKYFAQKYPNRIKKLVIVEAQIPPKVFKNKMDKNKVIFGGYKVRNAVLINYAVMYALMLNDNKVNVHTILIGKVSSDFFTGSRKEDLKATMLQVCLNTEDWRWKVVSPAFEPEFFKAFGSAQTKYAVGGYVGIGANMGISKSNLVGLNVRYYYTYVFGDGIEILTNNLRKSFGQFALSLTVGIMY